MVKKRRKNISKNRVCKGFREADAKPKRIAASTVYGTCTERLSPFGGLLALIKFLDLMDFEQVFQHTYRVPPESPDWGTTGWLWAF